MISKNNRSITVTVTVNFTNQTVQYGNNYNPIEIDYDMPNNFVYGDTASILLRCFQMGPPFIRGDFNLEDTYVIYIDRVINPFCQHQLY